MAKAEPGLPQAQRFLMQEVQGPASPADLAREVSSPEQAVQVYTAARIAVDLDGEEEHVFLTALAAQLGIDGSLAAHIDAAARSASTASAQGRRAGGKLGRAAIEQTRLQVGWRPPRTR